MSQWSINSAGEDAAPLEPGGRTHGPASGRGPRAPGGGTSIKSLGITSAFFGMLIAVGAVAALSAGRGNISHEPWRGEALLLLGAALLALGFLLLKRAARP